MKMLATALPNPLGNLALLWVRYDPDREAVAGKQPLAEWMLARRMKSYAKEADLLGVHLQHTRHTFVRIVAKMKRVCLKCRNLWSTRIW